MIRSESRAVADIFATNIKFPEKKSATILRSRFLSLKINVINTDSINHTWHCGKRPIVNLLSWHLNYFFSRPLAVLYGDTKKTNY